MIFRQWQQVLDGLKTQTRRLVKDGDVFVTWEVLQGEPFYVYRNGRKLWQVGRTYAIQPGRGRKAVGRFLLVEIRRERLQDISDEDAIAEGYPPLSELQKRSLEPIMLPRLWFSSLWDSIHKKPGTRWADDPDVWAYTFEVVK